MRDGTTLPPNLRQALREQVRAAFVERLDQLILYVSYAHGEATPSSDVDVLVVFTGDTGRSDTERTKESTLFETNTGRTGRSLSPLGGDGGTSPGRVRNDTVLPP